MANGGDPRFTTARASIERESTVVPPPPPANIPPPRSIATNRDSLTEENQSLLNSIRSSASITPQENQSLFNLMTSREEDGGSAQFREVVSRLEGDGNNLRKMALFLTSDVDGFFLPMARNKNGSNRMQELLGKSEDVDIFFYNAILRRFTDVMTHRNVSRVAIQGMRVFSEEKKTAMYQRVINHAVNMACDRGGYTVLKTIIDEWYALGNFFYGDQLLRIIAHNALYLSYHAHGNFVVQHVLSLDDLRYTHHVAVSLSGHCFGLSFTRFGHFVVENLLETEEGIMVVGELLYGCDEENLVRLTRSDYGNFVVAKALIVMRERNRKDLFWLLVNKLRPFVHLLRGSRAHRIGEYLESLY